MTRDEIKAEMRRRAEGPPWTPERLAREDETIDSLPSGTTVCFECSYLGVPQGVVIGREWEQAARTSGRVFVLGRID